MRETTLNSYKTIFNKNHSQSELIVGLPTEIIKTEKEQ